MKWKPISTCPKRHSPMFVVIGIDVDRGGYTYTTDPYCVWWNTTAGVGDERFPNNPPTHFARWPHPFEPTHWCELPDVKTEVEHDKE